MEEKTSSLGLRDIYFIIKKRILLIIGITIICGLTSGILSFYVIKPTYEAQTSLIVGKPQPVEKSQQFNDIIMYQNLAKTYSVIAQSRSVAESAQSKLSFYISVEDLQNNVTISTKEGTQFLYIKAENRNAQQAVSIVNAMTTAFIDESKRVFPTGGDIQVMDDAAFPKKPAKPRKKLNIALASLLGLFISTALAYMLEEMDRTIKNEDDVEKYLGLPVIGVIPKET